jgi:hypothetical protein
MVSFDWSINVIEIITRTPPMRSVSEYEYQVPCTLPPTARCVLSSFFFLFGFEEWYKFSVLDWIVVVFYHLSSK